MSAAITTAAIATAQSCVQGRVLGPAQVAERGLDFVRQFSDILAEQHAAGRLQPLFREAWAFSACTALSQVQAPTEHGSLFQRREGAARRGPPSGGR